MSDESENNGLICKQHSGVMARVKQLEGDLKNLWRKYDNMQKTLIGILIVLVANLGVELFK